MKKMKKMVALVLAMVMVLAMGSMTAFAEGTNSITVNNAKNGETYTIYKMLDLSVSYDSNNKPIAYRYTINATWRNFWVGGPGAEYIDTNTAGSDIYVVWKSNKQDPDSMEAFGKEAAEWAETNVSATGNSIVATENGESVTVTWSNLDNGYYLVTSTYGIAASVASTPADPAQTITEKNNGNVPDKEVLENAERNETGNTWGKGNDAQVGDTITFRTKVSIAKNSINVIYHDTMDPGLTFSGVDSVKVYTDEACTDNNQLVNSDVITYYTVTTNVEGETFQVNFDNDYVAGFTKPSTDLYVKYTAVLNDNAVVTKPEQNDGIVTWGNKGISEHTTTNTSTHKFTILKYDGTDTAKNPLAGAKFQLFTTENGGNALTLAVNADGTVYRVVDTSDGGVTLPEGYSLKQDKTIVTLATGVITVEGVDSDDYWLEETEAPIGYNKLTNRIKVEVDATNSYSAEIENNSGTLLPSTGGIGTTIFYVLGAILVLAAGVILVTRKRMSMND